VVKSYFNGGQGLGMIRCTQMQLRSSSASGLLVRSKLLKNRFRLFMAFAMQVMFLITFMRGCVFGQSQPTQSTDSTTLRAVNQLPLQLLGRPMSAFVTSLGTRLETAGLERTILVGTLSTPSSSGVPITVTRENPGRIRVVEGAATAQAIGIVDEQLQMATSAMPQDQLNLVETLLYDYQDYLLFDHANFGRTRFLGEAFTYPRASASERFSIFDHVTNVGLLEPGKTRTKRYYINIATGLLEYVVSWIGSGSAATMTETGITWQTVATQQFPASVTQWEKGAQVFAIQFTQASAGPTAADNAFVP
jgi:hypothetical protein